MIYVETGTDECVEPWFVAKFDETAAGLWSAVQCAAECDDPARGIYALVRVGRISLNLRLSTVPRWQDIWNESDAAIMLGIVERYRNRWDL